MKMSNSMVLTLIGIGVIFTLSWFNKPGSEAVASLVAGYIVARQAGKSSHVWAASKDPNASVSEIVEKVEGSK